MRRVSIVSAKLQRALAEIKAKEKGSSLATRDCANCYEEFQPETYRHTYCPRCQPWMDAGGKCHEAMLVNVNACRLKVGLPVLSPEKYRAYLRQEKEWRDSYKGLPR
jgi:hypothetical protein